MFNEIGDDVSKLGDGAKEKEMVYWIHTQYDISEEAFFITLSLPLTFLTTSYSWTITKLQCFETTAKTRKKIKA